MVTRFIELSNSRWEVIAPIFNIQRRRKNQLRDVLNAIFFVLRTGMQWRNLSQTRYPKWQSVYYYFYRWTNDGTFEQINYLLNLYDREQSGREPTPSLCCADAQSVKIAPLIKKEKGFDGNKKINGRKRQVLTDTLGHIWAAFVHGADRHDSTVGYELLIRAADMMPRLEKILTDKAYQGDFRMQAKEILDADVEIASRPPTEKGFVPVKKRWVVERTFGWLNFYRRLSKDYERTAKSAENMLLLCNCALILNRIT